MSNIPIFSAFLDQNYRYISVATHISHNAELLVCKNIYGKQHCLILALNYLKSLLLSILLISRSMDLWKICISSLYQIDKLSFPYILIFSLHFQLPIPSSVSQIIKELSSSTSLSSSSYSFHFRHLSVNGIIKKEIFPHCG